MSHSYALCVQLKLCYSKVNQWAVMGNELMMDDSNTILIFSSVESYDTSRCVFTIKR